MLTAAAYLREQADNLKRTASQRRQMIADLSGQIAALEEAARTFEDDAEMEAAASVLEGKGASTGSGGWLEAEKVPPPRDW